MEKIKITEQALATLGSQLGDLVIMDAVTDESLSYQHSHTDIVYHYTELSTLIKIIENQTIWASNLNCLNDKTEFHHGVNLIKKIINEVSNDRNRKILGEIITEIKRIYNTERYVACFSKNGDLKSQWMDYANKGKGVSIGFNKRNLKSSLIGHLKDKYILYDIKKQERVIKYFLERGVNFFLESWEHFEWEPYRFEQIAAVLMIQYLESFISDYKDSTFSEEVEYRLEYSIMDFMKAKKKDDIKFRSNNSLIIPYIELETKYRHFRRRKDEDEPESTILIKQLPIEEIIIGPSLNFNEVLYGLEELLRNNNYEHVKIKETKVPYRA